MVVLITVFCAVGVTVAVCIKIYWRNTVLHELTAHPNEAYGITNAHELTAEPKGAYGITDDHKVTVQPNEAYGITELTARPNEAYGIIKLTAQSNEVYGITDAHEVTVKLIDESEDTEYSYVQNS